MKHTIQAQFEKQMEKEGISTFIAFERAVRGRGFDRYLIGRWFKKLVDKDDYMRRDFDKLVEWLSRPCKMAQQSHHEK